ncbi:hypothetical protein ABS71_00705 [bacterium SCN 62-11]|nr:MAG: hypothetical protein ABS71_00705 [bacterium SCN 62-11]
MSSRRAFSLAELLIAAALFTITILGVMALSLSVLKTQRKANDLGEGKSVAQATLGRLLDQVRTDNPAGTRAGFFNSNSGTNPFQSGTSRVGRTDFQYRTYVTTVTDALNNPLGGTLPNNRLKNVQVEVNWWGADQSQNRSGYGRLSTTFTQLVGESQL